MIKEAQNPNSLSLLTKWPDKTFKLDLSHMQIYVPGEK